MKRYLLTITLSIFAIITIALPVLAITYSSPVSVSENGTASYPMLPLGFYVDNEYMADNGFMGASGNDTRIEALSGLEHPHMVADNATWFAIPVPINSQTNLFYTTWNSALDFFKMIFGVGGYFTVKDDPDLEPTDNLSIGISGYIDNSESAVGANITSKEEALRIYIGSTGNITVDVHQSPGWRSPTSHVDPGAEWTDEPNAYDGNTATWSTVPLPLNPAKTSYLELHIASLEIDKIRFYLSEAGTGGGAIDLCEVDIYYSGGWNNIYSDDPAEDAWVEAAVSPVQYVTAARIRLRNDNVAQLEDGRLKEFEFEATSSGIAANVSIIDVASGKENLSVSSDGTFLGIGLDRLPAGNMPIGDGLVLNAPFWQTALSGATFTTVDSTENSGSATDVSWSATDGRVFTAIDDANVNLGNDSNLHFGSGNFTRVGWYRFNSVAATIGLYHHIAGAGRGDRTYWNQADGKMWWEVNNEAGAGVFTRGDAWTPAIDTWYFIVWTRNGNTWTSHVNNVQVIGTADVSVYTAYTGDFQIGVGDAVGAGIDQELDGDIGEFQVYNKALSASERTALYDATKWKYDGSSGSINYVTIASVPDNSANWIFCQSAVMPYTDNISLTVGGARQLYFTPNSMILGTNLPDRESNGGSNNGTITWGVNSANITISVGGFIASSQPAIGASIFDDVLDILPDIDSSDWFVEPDVAGALLTNPLRPFVTIMSDTTNITELQAWRFLGLVFVILVLVITAGAVRSHLLVCGVATASAILVLVIMTIWPAWALVFALMAVITGMISERSPSV